MPATPDKPTAALAFDYGEQRIGVAFANRTTGTATALTTLSNRDPGVRERALRALVREWEPDTLVIGVPYNADGSESPLASAAVSFANRLAEEYALRVDRVDERLTSAEAGALLREQRQGGMRRRKVRKQDIDSMAAKLIAESWLRQS